MTELQEGALQFTFPSKVTASKYDEWTHYRKHLTILKAVDFVCYDPGPATTWLIEVKDYRAHSRTKPSELADEICQKVVHTLAGLVSARINAHHDSEKALADSVVGSRKLRVVVHLEQPSKPSRLKPRVIEPADLVQKLKPMLKAFDPRLKVCSKDKPVAGAPWTVR